MPYPATTHDDVRHLHLYLALTDHLTTAGVTITHADIDDDATWTARTRTLTLRTTAGILTHIEVLRDFIGMTTLGYASQLGAHPIRTRRHLTAVS